MAGYVMASAPPGFSPSGGGGFYFDEDGETPTAPLIYAPAPKTGFVANLKSAYVATNLEDRTDSRSVSLRQAYDPVVDALNAGFQPATGTTLVSPDRDKFFANPYHGEDLNPFRDAAGGMPEQETRIWAEIARRRQADPNFLASVGKTRSDFLGLVTARDAATVTQDKDVQANSTWGGSFGRFIGSTAATLSDPVTIPTLMLGGGPARSIGQAVLREAGVNAALSAATIPLTAQRHAELDDPITVAQGLADVGSAAVIGGVFGGGAHIGGQLLGKWRGKPIESLSDHEMAHAIETTAPSDPTVQAAAATLREKGDVDAANPFADTPTGRTQHYQALDQAQTSLSADDFHTAPTPPPVDQSVQDHLASFDQPAGEGQRAQIEALNHDIREMGSPAPADVGRAGALEKASPNPGVGGGMAASPASREARLTTAVSWQESRGNPDAVSSKGARGRMQVMPGTNTDPGFGVMPARDTSEAERTRVGQDYLHAMLSRYDGNETLALAAYNAGPGNADKWLRTIGDPRTGKISDADFAASIPFKETRNYVGAVLDHAGLADQPRMIATGEQVIDGDTVPIMQPLHEALAEHDADDHFISTVESCLA